MRKLIFTYVTILFTILTTNLFAQNNSQLSIQGVLRNANGTAVENGQYDIVFRLWNAPTNGTKIWEEEKTGVDVEGGIYSVVLGDGATPLDADFTEQYYLGVSVEGGTELIPRAALTSSPYALSLIGNDNVFPNSGNVGVGSFSPQHKLTVQRKNAILGLEADSTANNTSTITTTADGMQFDAGGTDKVYAFSNGRIQAIADKQFIIEGTDSSSLVFSKNSGNARLGFDVVNGDNFILSNPIGKTQIQGTEIELQGAEVKLLATDGMAKLIGDSNAELSFHPQGENGTPNGQIKVLTNGHMEIQSSGNVHINDHLKVGGETVTITPGTYFFGNAYNHGDGYPNAGPTPYAFRVVGARSLFEAEINVLSDKRVKKDFKLSKGNEDLNRLMEIEVTDYRYIDEMQYGKEFKKGVIAQQVKEIFPEAVGQAVNFIPNIYTFPTQIAKDKGVHTFTFTFANAHLLKKGDLLKFIVDKKVVKTTVSEIIDENSFSIDDWNEGTETEEIFLYGHQVNDRLAVDYDEIFTLNISATQELARKVEALEKENAALKNKSANAAQANLELKAEIKGMNKRLQAIELMLNVTGSK